MIPNAEPVPFLVSLQACCFCPRLRGQTKDEIIVEMVDALCEAGLLSDRDGVLESIRSREAMMSTGMQSGVALPHGKVASVSSLVTAIGLQPAGIDFDALDGEPSRIFVMTVSPSLAVGAHIRFLAAIGKLLDRPRVRDAVLKASSKEMLLTALLGEAPND